MLPLLEVEGALQMALDAWLLEQCIQSTQQSPVLRFYTWPGAWLSLGHHQHQQPEHWGALERSGALQRVRRPSGGGAVLHASGLTYALIWPNAPRSRREAYQITSQWLINGFDKIGVSLQAGLNPARANQTHCFASATPADLVDDQGEKRIGSAQFWRHGHLLQHGEILITPPADLWHALFEAEPPPPLHALTSSSICSALTTSLREFWPECTWQDESLTSEQWRDVKSLSERYRLS